LFAACNENWLPRQNCFNIFDAAATGGLLNAHEIAIEATMYAKVNLNGECCIWCS